MSLSGQTLSPVIALRILTLSLKGSVLKAWQVYREAVGGERYRTPGHVIFAEFVIVEIHGIHM